MTTIRTILDVFSTPCHWHSGERAGTTTYNIEFHVSEGEKTIVYYENIDVTLEEGIAMRDAFAASGVVDVAGMENLGDLNGGFDWDDQEQPEYDAERVALDRAYAGAF